MASLGRSRVVATRYPPSLDVYVQYHNCLPSAGEIEKHFSTFEAVMFVRLVPKKCCAFVHFKSLDGAGKAVSNGRGGKITNIDYSKPPTNPTINIKPNSTISVGFYQDDTFYCKTETKAIDGKIVSKKEGDIQILLNTIYKERDGKVCLDTFNYTFKRWQIEKVIPNDSQLLIVWSYRTGPLIYISRDDDKRTLHNPLMVTENDSNAIVISIKEGQTPADVFKKKGMLHDPSKWRVEYLDDNRLVRVPKHSLEIELLLESLVSLRIPKALITEEFYDMVNRTEPSQLKWALRLMLATSRDPTDALKSNPSEDDTLQPADFILDPAKALKDALERVSGKIKQSLQNQYRLIDGPSDEYMRTYMLEITPTKMFLTGPSIDQSNRVLRKYKDHAYHFIRVNFRDNDSNKLAAVNREFQEFFELKMKHGVQLGGKIFTFLAYANSEIREHSCYFVAPFEFDGELMTATEIINGLGTFTDSTVAKRASRIGQCFSSTIGGFAVTFPVEMIDDIHPLNELNQPNVKHNFSDGIGKISPDLAHALGYDSCAVQIRFGGFKGMVVVDTSLTGPNNCGDKYFAMHLRPSMKKFEANPSDNELEINGVAQYLPAYLNRQMITLLLAPGTLTLVKSLEDLREQVMKELIELTDDDVSESTLETLLPKYTTGFGGTVLEQVAHPFRHDLFVKNLLRLQCYKSVQRIVEKTRLRVQQGAHLYGVLDEHGYLEENQIFVRLQDDTLNPSLQQITGPAFVTRSPSLHPGDIRMVECVDVPQLHHLKNVIVFPRKGKRPMTDMISGGDLDGDRYTVIWDKTLFPTKDFEPMEYDKRIVRPETVIYPDSYIGFVGKVMATDRIGEVSNAWLAWAEMEPSEGALNEKCLRLAQLFSPVVDYPKTGGDPILIPNDLEPDQFPDFMENRFKPFFESNSFIGDTYRNCKKKLKDFAQGKMKDLDIDEDLLDYPGSEKWLKEAEDSFEDYKFRLLQLMRMYRVTQVEAFSGIILASDKYMKHRQNASELNIRFLEIRHDILNQFKHGLADEESDDMFAKASAWYTMAYQIKKHFPSFAWLIYDKLLQLKEAKHQG